jgi:hypothetical protein
MLIWVTEIRSGNQIAINTKKVIAAFEVVEENDSKGKTAISLENGTVVVEDSLLEVFSRINAGEQ